MEYLLHSYGLISGLMLARNFMRRRNYLSQDNYGLTKIMPGSKITYIYDYHKQIPNFFFHCYPFPFMVSPLFGTYNNPMKECYFKSDDANLKYKINSYMNYNNVHISDFNHQNKSNRACLNGE